MTRDTMAVCITSGEPSTTECVLALEAQEAPVFVGMVVHVSPMWRAFQSMVEKAGDLPYLVQVDADMILVPEAVGWLRDFMEEQPTEVAFVCGWLYGDAEEMPIIGVKMYRTEVLKKYPYRDSLSCEMTQYEEMQKDGYRFELLPQDKICGIHKSLQTPEMAFSRWKRLAIKHRRLPWLAWVPERAARMRYASGLRKYAYHGFVAGSSGAHPATESDASMPDMDFLRAFGRGDGPTQLNVYATSRCNLKCSYCLRETKAPTAPDISIETLALVMSKFPMINTACIAGFGEPTMHGDLAGLVVFLQEKGVDVTVITNGHGSVGACRPNTIGVSVGDKRGPDMLDGLKRYIGKADHVAAYYTVTNADRSRLVHLVEEAVMAGASSVALNNLLPHNGRTEEWSRDVVKEPTGVSSEWSRYVTYWPRPVRMGQPGGCCRSPWESIGIDGNGNVTGCRRMVPPSSKHGNIRDDGVWFNQHFEELRMGLTGDRPVQDECLGCFAYYTKD